MKQLFFTLFLTIVFTFNIFAQDYKKSIIDFQTELNEELKRRRTSPLTRKERKKFKGLSFFPIDEKYKVKASFKRVKNATPFQMKTSTDRMPTYEKFGIATFKINNKEYQLNIYQSHRLRKIEAFKSYLFLPFMDLTSGEETYGGGRFIDLKIPEGDFIIIDFNKAYHPTCIYNHNYSCPIPPRENNLEVKIEAGIKLSQTH